MTRLYTILSIIFSAILISPIYTIVTKMFMSQTQVSFEIPTSAIYERKFDTAIRSSFNLGMEERISKDHLTFDDRILLENAVLPYNGQNAISTPDCYARILQHLLSDRMSYTMESSLRALVPRISECSNLTLEIQLRYITEQNLTYLQKRIRSLSYKYLMSDRGSSTLTNLIVLSTWMVTVVESLNKINSPAFRRLSPKEKLSETLKVCYAICPYMDLTFVWSYSRVLIRINGLLYILPRPYVLLIHNKICDLISVLVFASFCANTVYPADIFDVTVEFVKVLIDLVIEMKEKAFDVLRVIESLGIAETLVEVDDWKNDAFLKAITNDLEESCGFDYSDSELKVILTQVSIPVRHELMCLSKIVGHPLVDMAEGSKALYENVSKVSEIDPYYILQVINYIKENYIRNHILKYGRWPPSRLTSKMAPKALEMAFIMNKDPNNEHIKRRYGLVSIKDYIYVEILPNMKFSKLENSIPYLKDKTISLMRSKVVSKYLSPNGANEEYIKTTWAETRCLLAYLLHPTFVHDHIKFLEKYTYDPDFEEILDYLVMRVVPKEKELKVNFRGFGCKTYEYRLGTLAQEKAAMQYLDEYSDDQAMTVNELQLLKRLRAFRSMAKAYKGHEILYIVVDASKWNNMFRDSTVDFCMEDTLDKVFNYPIFSHTHKAYQKTLIYIPDGDTVYWWDGQDGGIEGQNQDTWVVVYIGQLKKALEGLGVKFHLIVKGDDCRIAVAIPLQLLESSTMEGLRKKIVDRIASMMCHVNHKIKVEESYGSGKYFAFSKSASCNNIELPQGFRKIQKCYGSSNAFLPTLDDYTAATFSNAHSTCKTEPIVTPAYMTALFWFFYYLLNDPGYTKLNQDALVALALVPNMLGGFPVIYYHNMHVRAESDLLSPFLGILNLCKKRYWGVYEVMINFLCIPPTRPELKVMLFRDPYALPSDRPILPSTKLRSYITPALRRISKNEDIKELIEASHSEEQNLMNQVLSSAEPYHAKVVSSIFSSTPQGVLEELLRKFESARSINELIILRYGKARSSNMIRNVVRTEKRLQRWRIKRAEGLNLDTVVPLSQYVTECPAESAHLCREKAWGTVIEGVTMPPLQHQLFLAAGSITLHDEWARMNHFKINLKPSSMTVDKTHHEHYSTTDSEPFVGFTTRTGNIAPVAHFVEKDPILTKVKNLLDLSSWVNISQVDEEGNEVISNAPEVIIRVLKTYTDTKFSDLNPFGGKRKSGTIQHHIRAPNFRESIVPNVLSNVYTRFSGESNSHVRLRTSSSHYKINFLHCFCYTCWNITLELEFSMSTTTPEELWVITTPCTFCNKPILERPIVFNEKLVKQIDCTPLKITRLGEISEQSLVNSVAEMKSRNPRVTQLLGNMTPELITIALLQEILNDSHYRRRLIQDRYGEGNLTREAAGILTDLAPRGHTRDVGLTEVKNLQMDVLCTSLTTLVGSFVFTRMKLKDFADMAPVLMEIPPEEYPWSGLLYHLHRIGRLTSLIRWFYTRSQIPPPACYYNPDVASRYVAHAGSTIHLWEGAHSPCVMLSYYDSGSFYPHCLYTLRGRIWRFIKDTYANLLKTIKFDSLDDEIKPVTVKNAYRAVMCIYMYDEMESALICSIEDIVASCYTDIDVLGLVDIEIVVFLEWLGQLEYSHPLVNQTMSHSVFVAAEFNNDNKFQEEELEDMVITVRSDPSGARLEILYSTLDQCIMAGRSMRGPNEEEDIGTVTNQTSTLPREWSGMPRDFPHARSEKYPVGPTDPLQDVYCDNHVMLELSENRHMPQVMDFYKVMGHHSGSETTLYEILHEAGLLKSIPRNCSIASIADGTGGFTNLLNVLSGYTASFMFHSLPDGDTLEVGPQSAYANDPSLIERTYTNHINEGYVSLVEDSTWRRFLEYNQVFAYVVCDLEPINTSLTEYGQMLFNLGKFFILSGHLEGALISKVYIDHTYAIDKMISLLKPYVKYLTILKTEHTSKPAIAYVFAYGLTKQYLTDIPYSKVAVDTEVCKRTRAFQHRMSLEADQKVLDNIPVYELIPAHHLLLDKYMMIVGMRIEEHLRHIMGYNIKLGDEQTFMNVLDEYKKLPTRASLDRYGLDPEGYIVYWLKKLKIRDVQEVVKFQTWTPETRIHRLLYLKYFWRSVGFFLGSYDNNNLYPKIVIRAGGLYNRYLDFSTMLDKREFGTLSREECFKGFFINRVKYSFGKWLSEGYTTFLMFLGTISHLDTTWRKEIQAKATD